MASDYTDLQFRLQIQSPVSADSAFDSDTLWGRLLCQLMDGSADERSLADEWLADLRVVKANGEAWEPPLILSEGFQCDSAGNPWLPLPLALRLKLDLDARPEERKKLKEIRAVPLQKFAEICINGLATFQELFEFEVGPCIEPGLQPHLGMNRASGTGAEGLLYLTALRIYSQGSKPLHSTSVQYTVANAASATLSPEVAFLIRLRGGQKADLIRSALRRICEEGWGTSKSRGLGQVRFKSLEPWKPPAVLLNPNGFVSLSHFCPARNNPTDGRWKLQVKHPVPTQFVNGKRVVLGNSNVWRVKSFLRLTAGSCFRLEQNSPASRFYGRMLTRLLEPAEDGSGHPLPELFHYGLAYAWPMRWPTSP